MLHTQRGCLNSRLRGHILRLHDHPHFYLTIAPSDERFVSFRSTFIKVILSIDSNTPFVGQIVFVLSLNFRAP